MDDRAKQFKTSAESQLSGPALKKEINTLRRFLFRNQEYRFTKAAQQALYMAVLAHYGNPAAHLASCLPPSVTTTSASPSTTFGTGGASPPPTPAAPSASTATAPVTGPTKVSDRPSDNDEDEGRESDAAAEAPILRLLDDALKMPFTVFTSPQKDKLLSLYWAVLGTDGSSNGGRGASGSGVGGGGAAAAAAVVVQEFSLMDIVDVGKNKAHLSLFADDGDEYAQEVLVDDAATLKQLKKEFDEGKAVVVTVQETDSGARFLSFTVDE
jgi:hypothetical protein